MTAVLVRNREGGPTVFTDAATKVQVEWAGAGDPGGADHQYVPAEVLDNVQFMKGLQRGIFEVIETAAPLPQPSHMAPPDQVGAPPAAQLPEAIALQRAAYERRQADALAASQAVIVETANNDIITQPCIGPSGRPGPGKCNEPVPVTEKQARDAAPLCSKHEGLRPEFAPIETEKMNQDTGKAEVRWVRSKVTATERPV